MKHAILADECIPHDSIIALKAAGFSVYTVSACGLSGKPDEDIFDYAVKHSLPLFTFDRGFGDIFRFNHSKCNGVIIVLVKSMAKEEIINLPIAFLQTYQQIKGKLIIIGVRKVRVIQR